VRHLPRSACSAAPRTAAVIAQRHHQVVAHALRLEHGWALELAADAARAIWLSDSRADRAGVAEPHPALVRPGLAGNDVHEGGLARSVRPDDGAQFLPPISNDRLLIALNPSNETEIEVTSRSALTMQHPS
jgi:hypothetical protein